MGTKNNPGKYDCYEKAEPDEPIFVLRANDLLAPDLVRVWARRAEIMGQDADKVAEARECARKMNDWRHTVRGGK